MSVPLLPDAEVLLVAFLASHPLLVPLHGGRVGTQLDRGRPALRVTRVGRGPADWWEDAPELQVDAWAATQDEASVLIRSVIAALEDVEGVHAEGAVRGHEVVRGPIWAPDPDTTEARYLLDVVLLTYPNT